MAPGLAMRLGLMPGISRRLMLGDQFCTNLETTVGGGVDPGERLSFNRTPTALSIASTSATDTLVAGSGAQVVQVRYIDVDGDEQLEIFTLFGTSPTALTIPPLGIPGAPGPAALIQCINFIGVAVTGTPDGANEGRIYIGETSDSFTNGKPDNNIWGVVELGRSLSNSIFNMIPAAISSHLVQFTFSSDSTEKNDGLIVREKTHQRIAITGGSILRNVLNIHILGNITLNGISFAGFNPGDVFELTSQTEGNAAVSISCAGSFMDVRNDVYPPTTEGPIIG